ncbi:complement receptor type 1 [Neoarius graeffei]|uniref:complement receptor type 1 n=1 Tax=Neoarius graeffei TaxID=443677 RepID=UPI00298D2411|nr:complement receptor type 1 [Neoarius graeffei]
MAAALLWSSVLLVFCARLVAPSRRGTCPLLEGSNKATFHGTKNTYHPGETLSYSCNVGFRLQGSSNILKCEMDGNWKPRKAKCQRIKCEEFTIANGQIKPRYLRFNSKVSITCNDGYQLRGSSVVTCGADESWTPALPTCEQVMPVQVTCPPPAVPNTSGQDRYKMEYEVGEHATIFCQEGFELIGSSQVTCGADSQWQTIPECRLIGEKCQPPPYFPNAYTEHNDQSQYEPDTAVHFKCNHGYRMVRGPSTIHCRNGRWTDLEMICEKKKCGSAGEIENGRYHYTGASFGDTATANCNVGYQLVGVGVRHCSANGWDGRVPVCEAIQCPEPPLVPDAYLDFDASGIIKHGYIASYRCRVGTLIGASDIICTEDGTWSAPAPRCEVTCPAPNVRFAVIDSGVRPPHRAGSSVTFMCYPGRRLSGPRVITCGEDGYWKPRLPHCVI